MNVVIIINFSAQAYYGWNTPNSVILDDVHCYGTESNIAQCTNNGIGTHDCNAAIEAAGVQCTTYTVPAPSPPSPPSHPSKKKRVPNRD